MDLNKYDEAKELRTEIDALKARLDQLETVWQRYLTSMANPDAALHKAIRGSVDAAPYLVNRSSIAMTPEECVEWLEMTIRRTEGRIDKLETTFEQL